MIEPNAFWKDFARRREDPWVQALSRLLAVNTVSGDSDPAAMKAWRSRIGQGFDDLTELARGLGFPTRRHEDRVLVIEASGPEGAPVLAFPIHLDVVPAGEGWTRDPFGGEVADGTIWGRGTQDDKGPIIQVLFGLKGAAELAEQTGRKFTKTVRIIVPSEEECGVWDDIPYYFEREGRPDFTIVPDACFPITNGEKGMVDVKVEFGWAPELGDAFEIVAGERSNIVPSVARLKAGPALLEDMVNAGQLGQDLLDAPKPPKVTANGALEAEFYGIGAHGSLPWKGYNAAVDALAQAASLPAVRRSPAGRILAWLAQAGRDTTGGFLDIAVSHPKVGPTTVNLGLLRVGRAGASATLNIRHAIGLTCGEVEARVRHAAEKLGRHTSGITRTDVGRAEGREPIYVDPEQFTEWIRPMQEAYTAVTGRPAGLQSIGGTTFAKAFPNAVCFGPVDESEEMEMAHQADEHVTLAAMRRNVEIYGRAIAGIVL